MNISSSLSYYIQRIGIIGLFTYLFFLSAPAHARLSDGELFAPGDSQVLQEVETSIVRRQRAVEVVHSAIDQDYDILYLNLFDDVYIEALKDHVVIDSSGNYAWIGTIAGVNESQVTIVVSGETLSASIILPEVYYHLRPVEGNKHVVREIDPLAFPVTTTPLSLSNSYEPYTLSNSDVLDNSGNQLNNPVPAANSISQAQTTIFFPEEQAVFDRVNQERAIVGLPPLASNESLTVAARNHSQDMSANNYFSHTSQDGRSPADRITNAGYSWNNYGENIAWGYTTPEMVMNGWMTSSGHRANILRASFCDLGVGYEPVGNYWTQDFGRQQGMATCPNDGGGNGGDNGGGNGGGGGSNGDDAIHETNFGASIGDWLHFNIDVPAGATSLTATINGGSGDADLYVRYDAQPTIYQWHFRPYLYGNNETINVISPPPGTWYISIRAYSNYSGVSLNVTYN